MSGLGFLLQASILIHKILPELCLQFDEGPVIGQMIDGIARHAGHFRHESEIEGEHGQVNEP